MADKTEFLQAIDDAILDADSLEQFINGSDSETVLTRLSAEYPTLQKALKELFENGAIADRFKTLADLQASPLVDGSYALVADDADDKNGIYIKDGGTWVKSKYSPNKNTLRIIGKDAFTISTSSTQYSSTDFIPLNPWEKKGLIRCQSQSKAYIVVCKLNNGTTQTIIDSQPIGNGDVLRQFDIPSDAKDIKAYAANNTYDKYNSNIPPVLILGAYNDNLYSALNAYDEVLVKTAQLPARRYSTYDDLLSSNVTDGTLAYVTSDPDSLKNGYYYKKEGGLIFKRDGVKSLLDEAFSKSDPSFKFYGKDEFVGAVSKPEYTSTPRIDISPDDFVYVQLQSQSKAETVVGWILGVRTVLEPANAVGADFTSKFVEIPTGTTRIQVTAANETYPNYSGDPFVIIGKDKDEILEKVQEINKGSSDSSASKVEVYTSNSMQITPTLKAVREMSATDGTERLVVEYLWHDDDNNFYLSSSIKGTKVLAFKFNPANFGGINHTFWSMSFDKFGNILCVYRTEYASWDNYSDDVSRKNPVLLVKSEGYKAKTIDFGDGKKPSAWIQNSGFLATEDAVFIAEYTRPSVQTANCWKATYPLDDPNNWKTVQTFELSPEPYPSDNLKHMHSVERDPHTGFIYTTTGDEDAGSAMYVSVDNGETFSAILTGSQKYCRVLNFVFTKDAIYWATDSVKGKHFFFKAERNIEGVLDTANIVDVRMFPLDSPATYATIHLPKINALVFLSREDYSASTPAKIDMYDLQNNTFVENVFSINPINGLAGFRCECFEYVPRGNDIVCGFSGASSYLNNNAVLGNKGWVADSKIGNIILTVDRLGDAFTVSVSTTV